MNRKNLLIILVLIIAGAGTAWYFLQSDTRRIKKQFGYLSEYVLKEGQENTIMMALKVKNIGTLFSKRCVLEVEQYMMTGTYSPEQITSHAATARVQFTKVELKFYDINIEFPVEGKALITATANLAGTTKSGEIINDAHEIVAEMKKVERDWLFGRISVVEVLKK